ncbi:MAG: Type 4 prepilin-like protein leader peptide-processing enzyme [Candidatus Wolfebacteria bacterium GW2011_GWC1_43_10]|uniref:Type 4 prepilin-like protein leader peptide-processing enzyme n=1 Tax=Candidatus Wolfebacteria bacterium GW2011_GWC1_43_10 TaxID=1619011 RepID=A0A0G1CAJ7_9BACT|nr:MAG: Type 4 prepilin-like protein leader peptide-processing enzyme [Candidatus Wolfebacteria bacterium GW2011_GWC1_43_10]KKT22523.1 MAG: Type 4 prepilin-like protein leader peptide-processing enzyme [Parcubacteria group bacterium GW2011_GWB1_43_8b]
MPASDWFYYLILFAVGLAFGSFLNVLTLRYHPGKKLFASDNIGGRSACLHCRKVLSWYELVPLVSFFVQGGKCRHCQKKLSFQYPLVELAGGLIFLFVPLFLQKFFFYFNPVWGEVIFLSFSLVWILVFLSLLLAFIIDLKHYVIPNTIGLILFFLGIIWILLGVFGGTFASSFNGSFLKNFHILFPAVGNIWLAHLVGAAAGGIFFFLIVLASRGRAMGMGDVKLITALGLLFGWPDIVLIIFLSFILGAVVSLILMALGRKKISDLVPFGPFIVLAAGLVFFFGARLLSLYFGIIGM